MVMAFFITIFFLAVFSLIVHLIIDNRKKIWKSLQG